MEILNMRKFLAAFSFAAFTAGLAIAPVSFDLSAGLKTSAAFAQEKQDTKKDAAKPKKEKAKKDKPKKDKPKKDKPKKEKKSDGKKAETPAAKQ